MATVSERARICASGLIGCDFAMAQKLIEQALLAERRLAMEEAAKIALSACDELKAFAIGDHVANAIRAAAEKEVSK